jgi:hypothetical protein
MGKNIVNDWQYVIYALGFILILSFIVFGIFMYKKNNANTKQDIIIRRSVEKFVECTPSAGPVYKSAISAGSGIGFVIEKNTNVSGGGTYYYVYYTSPNIDPPDSVFAVDTSSGQPILTRQAYGIDSQAQAWKIIEAGDISGDLKGITDSPYSPKMYYLESNGKPGHVLQFENGNMVLRLKGGFPSQKWVLSTDEIISKNAIPVVNYDQTPGAETIKTDMRNTFLKSQLVNELNANNQKKINDVLDLIRQNMQALNTSGYGVNGGQVSSSSLGVTGNPIKINLLMSGDSAASSSSTTENFTDSASKSVSQLLDDYEGNSNGLSSTAQSFISQIKSGAGSCKPVNMNDYTERRIGQCNCKL